MGPQSCPWRGSEEPQFVFIYKTMKENNDNTKTLCSQKLCVCIQRRLQSQAKDCRFPPWTKKASLVSLLANFSPFWALLCVCWGTEGEGRVGLAAAFQTNSCKVGERRGTFLLLVIKGKNKRGIMKIKENKQWSSLFFSICLWSPAVCPTMEEELDWDMDATSAPPACKTKDAYTESVLWDWGDRSLTAPSPTQPQSLGLHEETAGWEDIQAAEGSEPGRHVVWPLAVRWEVVALKVSTRSNRLGNGLRYGWRPYHQIVDTLSHYGHLLSSLFSGLSATSNTSFKHLGSNLTQI